jgi:hypothetical protein
MLVLMRPEATISAFSHVSQVLPTARVLSVSAGALVSPIPTKFDRISNDASMPVSRVILFSNHRWPI